VIGGGDLGREADLWNRPSWISVEIVDGEEERKEASDVMVASSGFGLFDLWTSFYERRYPY
jgi:hypothetical protein